MSAYFVGIDPGLSGAVVVLNEFGEFYHSWRTPVVGGELDMPEMAAILRDYTDDGIRCAAIEKVSAMPKQGVTGVFTFGTGFGSWLGILAALRIPYVLVRPQEWQKQVTLPKKPPMHDIVTHPKEHAHDSTSHKRACKAAIVRAARARWPALPIRLVKDWGLADAAFIAEYARQNQQVKA